MPNAGRDDYNALDSFNQLGAGEPYFRTRGRDVLSGPAARGWAALAYDAGVPIAAIEQALQQADRLDAHPEKRLPNADHLSAADAKQLEYQFSRRARAAAADAADPRIMLAEQRAYDAVLGKIRPLLTQLFAGGSESEDGSFVYTPPVDATGGPLKLARSAIAALRDFANTLRPEPPSQRNANIDTDLLVSWLAPLAHSNPALFDAAIEQGVNDVASSLTANGERNPRDEATLNVLHSLRAAVSAPAHMLPEQQPA